MSGCRVLDILREIRPDVDFLSREGLVDGNVLDSFDIITLVAENFNSYARIKALVERILEEAGDG